jgi:hypothetical protein
VFHFGTFLATGRVSGENEQSARTPLIHMTFHKLISACSVFFLALCFAEFGYADTINSEGSSYGSPVDLSDLAALGLSPGSFLFSQNTMYDFTGNQELSIVSAEVDPSQTQSLTGVPVQITNVTLGDSSDDSPDVMTSSPTLDTTNDFGLPEPKTILLTVVGFGGLIAFGIRKRARDRVPGEIG